MCLKMILGISEAMYSSESYGCSRIGLDWLGTKDIEFESSASATYLLVGWVPG